MNQCCLPQSQQVLAQAPAAKAQGEFSFGRQEYGLDGPWNGQGQKDVLHVGAQGISHRHACLCNW